MSYGIIYKYTNKIDGKSYIGLTTKTIEKRWKQHVRNSKTPQYPFHYAIQKYGPETFTLEILCECSTQEELYEKEKFWAETFNTFIPNGYNLSAGLGPGSVSDETKNKLSSMRSGEGNSMFGKHHSEKTKEMMRQSLRGRKLSKNSIRKREATRKEKYEVIGYPNKGRKAPLSEREKLSKSHETGRVWVFISPEGFVVSTTNLRRFCRETPGELVHSRLSEVARGKRDNHKGWRINKG